MKNRNFTNFIRLGIENEDGIIIAKAVNKITAFIEVTNRDNGYMDNKDQFTEADNYGRFLSTIAESNLTINSFIVKDRETNSTNEEDQYDTYTYAQDIYNQYTSQFRIDGVFQNRFYIALTLDISKINLDFEINNLQTIVNRFISYFGEDNSHQLKPYSKQIIDQEKLQSYEMIVSPVRSLIYQITTGFYSEIGYSHSFIATVFDNVEIEVKGDLGLIKTPYTQKFFKIIELVDLPDAIESPALGSILSIGCEAVVSQVFRGTDKNKAISNIRSKEKELNSVESRNAKQYDYADILYNQVINDEVTLGSYTLTIKVYGETVEELIKHINDIRNGLLTYGIQARIPKESTFDSMLPSLFGMIPMQESYLTRELNYFTTQAYSAMSSIVSSYKGKKTGNPWGNAVTQFKTPSNSTYFFNYHVDIDGNNFGGNELGHTMLLGVSGAGKTITLNFLLNMSLKYSSPESFYDPITNLRSNGSNNFTLVVFDKDYGCQLNIQALGGTYFQIKQNVSTGLNPFACANTEDNKYHVLLLLKQMLQGNSDFILNDVQLAILEEAISNIFMNFDQLKESNMIDEYHRRLAYPITNLINSISKSPDVQAENSLKIKLKNWTKEGRYGWIFDNGTIVESFNIYGNNVIGIDGTDFLDEPEIASPISFYLLSKIKNLLDGRRTIIAIDECWKWLQNAEIQIYIRDMLKTMRKSNGLMVLATQSPEEILRSPIGITLIEQCSTSILLANPNAKYEDYRRFNLTPVEFDLLRSFRVKSRLAMIKKSNKTTVISLDLSRLSKLNLALLSGSKENVSIVNDLINQGMNKEEWINEFKKIKHY